MTKVIVEPGICGFTMKVSAEMNEDEEVVVKVATGCESIRNMMKELGDTYDPMEVCLQKPGKGPFYEYAQAHFPVHVACPGINGIIKCIEAESHLALKHDASIRFVEE